MGLYIHLNIIEVSCQYSFIINFIQIHSVLINNNKANFPHHHQTMVYPAFASRRSTVLSKYAAVATSDPIATEVGLSLIKKGGNAADAAVGIAAVLNLVDPGSTGLGGDCFVMFYDAKTKTVKGINGR